MIAGSINTLTDFAVVILPLPTVFALKTHRRQQIILCSIFGAGFVVCIAGIVRTIYSWRTADTYDRTWESFGLYISSVVELYVGLVSFILALTCYSQHPFLSPKQNISRSSLPLKFIIIPDFIHRSAPQSHHANLSSAASYLRFSAPHLTALSGTPPTKSHTRYPTRI